MEQQQFIIQMLPVIMRMDIRLQVHTYTETDGVFTDNPKYCPLCQAIWILENYG